MIFTFTFANYYGMQGKKPKVLAREIDGTAPVILVRRHTPTWTLILVVCT
jgi:hypothetical protein